MPCRTPRETCGSCDFKKTSSRSKGSDCSTVIESLRLAMGRRRNRRGGALALRPVRKPEPKRGPDRENNDASRLAGRQARAGRHVVITAEAFREGAQDRVTDQVDAKDLAV